MTTQHTIARVDQLDDPPSNPNRMPASTFRLLVEAIKRIGFVQPVLVRQVPVMLAPGEATPEPRYQIVDGWHRVRAAREAGLTDVPVVITDLDANQARAVQVGMNKMRGELDLSAVSSLVDELHTDGWDLEALALTGFDSSELTDMLRAMSSDSDDVLNGAPAAMPDAVEPAVKPFVLELTFATKDELAKAKKGLRKAAGKGGDMALGLIRLIEGN